MGIHRFTYARAWEKSYIYTVMTKRCHGLRPNRTDKGYFVMHFFVNFMSRTMTMTMERRYATFLACIFVTLCIPQHCATAQSVQIPFRINCGGNGFEDSVGRVWNSDIYNGGVGNTYAVQDSIIVSEDYDQELYKSERWDPQEEPIMYYSIPVDNDEYLIRLHFAEIYLPSEYVGARIFDIAIEDTLVATNFDILSFVAHYTAYIVDWTATVSDGILDIAMLHVSENPKISGIEVLAKSLSEQEPQATPRPTFQPSAQPSVQPIVTQINGPAVVGFSLVEAGKAFTNAPIQTLSNGDTIILGDLPAITIRAETIGPPMGSVQFKVDGVTVNTEIDAPYAVNGDADGVYIGWSPPLGFHSVEAIIFSLPGGQGNMISTLSMTLNFIQTELIDSPTLEPIYINAGGGEFRDSQQRLWVRDTDYDTHKKSKSFATADSISVSEEFDQSLYKSERWDPAAGPELEYSIDLPNGLYQVRLHFAEIFLSSAAVGVRVFDVMIENKRVLENFDILSEVPHDTALIKDATVTVVDGELNIELVHVSENPKISGIEIHQLFDTSSQSFAPTASPGGEPSSTSSSYINEEGFVPVYINVGGNNYTDSTGKLWVADSEYNFHNNTGSTYRVGGDIEGTDMDELYRSERWDPWDTNELEYTIPIASGEYLLKLHFAEIYVSSQEERVFDVVVEGYVVQYDLDIFKEVGAFTALVKSLPTTVNDGELNIRLLHWIDNPKLSAIEILPMPTAPALVEIPGGCIEGSCSSCEGSCLSSSDCGDGLLCFLRSGDEAVPGCEGDGTSGSGYCYRPEQPLLKLFAASTCSADSPCDVCEGDCSRDSHCGTGLKCGQRYGDEPVQGCSGEPISNFDYCYDPTPDTITLTLYSKDCGGEECARCEGNCQGDHDCQGDLKCYPREGLESIPGCFGSGLIGANYCFEPPVSEPIVVPNALTLTDIACNGTSPCEVCEGGCTLDTDCAGNLRCLVRSDTQAVPGCVRGMIGDVSGTNYCYEPPASGSVTYYPGKLMPVSATGMSLSQGLEARAVAIEREPVKYTSGGQSSVPFHVNPDAGATFPKSDGGWIYVSNSETDPGGVGALHFDMSGNVTKYEMITTTSNWNCGGGKTWWNTWITCEEKYQGQVWETDPWGTRTARKTSLGGDEGGYFESFAYDRSDPVNPSFYVTEDSGDGALRRFTPDAQAVITANDTGDYGELLHSNETGTAKIEYLLIQPDAQDPNEGTFRWVGEEDRGDARIDAATYYPFSEGIDIRDGILYMTGKVPKILMIMDLVNLTYKRTSTVSGAFEGEPDQIQRILGDNLDDSILYFCEDSPDDNAGVHGRDAQGNFYSILAGTDLNGETTGLAFSPDYKHMYVSYQFEGIIFDITRTDGYPFGGMRLDIKYHAADGEGASGDTS